MHVRANHIELKRVFGVVLVAVTVVVGCTKAGRQAAVPEGDVAAKVGDRVITVSELQAELNEKSAFVRTRYSRPEQKRAYLENRIRTEVLAIEAEKLGYDKDPDVVRVMKQEMISRFLHREIDSQLAPEKIPAKEVRAYFDDHQDQYSRPAEVRARQIVLADGALAQSVLALAQKLAPGDDKGFQKLVDKHSEDPAHKARGGDLMFFSENDPRIPGPVATAAFRLETVGDISPVVEVDGKLHILRLMEKRAGYQRALSDVEPQIRQHLVRQQRKARLRALLDDARAKADIQINEEALANISVDPKPSQASD